ncbi:TetR/AcrR family transcriptional regulator [Mucilaginibacter sp.]|jgi:TetR/AcrR family transcriptional repressor of nem operon|uniref:TetR/AcrR family transcriptional regulator n=1 Tax=Mucilaginibacter sp. TaxID=1882438 RepID=UPI002BB37E36|nr:TetR/AcrR family transcriptional regulator [Mucilaginibacter sp.]HTI61722.1 TetR/AcrR family transcriptional regulator [Mucilaginibacter sp.]
MARPRQYDEDAVIDKALSVFWKKGFSDTSSRDLIAATGMSNGSLFNSFGDKTTLYLACLQKYNATYIAALESLLISELPFKEKIQKVFEGTAKKVSATDDYEGCFFFNSSVDSGIHDAAISTLTAAIQLRLEKAFCTAADQARESKQLPIESDSVQIAQYLMMITTGLRAMVKGNASVAEIDHIIHSALKFLPF